MTSSALRMSNTLALLLAGAAIASATTGDKRPADLLVAPQPFRLVADVAPGGPAPGGNLVDLTVWTGRPYLLTAETPTGLSLRSFEEASGERVIWRDACCSTGQFWGALGKTIFWVAHEEGRWGNVLWRSDGTVGGTRPVMYQGRILHVFADGSETSMHALFDGALFFNAEFDQQFSLYRFDPEEDEATQVVQGSVEWLTAALGRLFFVQYDFVQTLFAMERDLHPFAVESFDDFASPRLLTATSDHLFFIAGKGEDEELWATDANLFTVEPVTTFKAPQPFELTDSLKAIDGRLYFVAEDGLHGQELWRSDGTAKGTVRLTEFAYAYPFGGYGPALAQTAGRLVFWASDTEATRKLWVNTGTPGSTRVLLDPCPPGCPGGSSGALLRVGNRILLSLNASGKGLEPWMTDGTTAGTQLLGDLCAGACSSQPVFRPAAGTHAFIVGRQNATAGIWETDGTSAGTKLIAQPSAQLPVGTVVPGPRATYFWAGRTEAGMQLWQTSGTPQSVQALTALAARSPGSKPQGIEAVGERVVFQACQESQPALWSVTPQGAGLEALAAFPGSPCDLPATSAVISGGRLAFLHRDHPAQPAQLWSTDGTASGTLGLTSFEPPRRLASALISLAGDVLFFVADDTKLELWNSDGSAAGTAVSFEIPESPRFIAVFPASPNEFFFLTSNGEPAVSALWRSDGTAAGTRIIQTGRRPAGSSSRFVRAGSWTYFLAKADSGSTFELWRTDGTAAGTTSVSSVGYEEPGDLVARGSEVFFLQPLGGRPFLWRSDGTTDGTAGIALAGRQSYETRRASNLTLLGPTLFFSAGDLDHGLELWSSNGTEAGTGVLKNIAVGDQSSAPTDFVVAGGRLYFTADDKVHGAELWTTDGTSAGTRMVQDLAPGPQSSGPQGTKLLNDRLFFSADDGIYGRELWALPLSPPSPPCAPSAEHLCLSGGRYQVEAFWRDFQGHAGTGKAVSLTGDTGYFWFFDPANVEVVLKVLDGTGLNSHRWVFYGALSSVEYSLTVTDTMTGAARRYVNPPGTLASVGDTSAFGPNGATPSSLSTGPRGESVSPRVEQTHAAAAGVACVASATRLCLYDGRFVLEVAWKDFQDHTGTGMAVSLTEDTGYFWFFDAANVEVVIKLLDGGALNGKFWLFYGALSSVEYTITVTDTQTGVTKQYQNPPGKLASVADTGAF